MSIKEARSGSALRRWRIAFSSSPSHVRDRAMIRGARATSARCWEVLVLGVLVAVVLGCSVVVVMEVWVELGSLTVVTTAASGESLRILRGREGILAGGDVIGGGMVVDSVLVVVITVVVGSFSGRW